MSDVLRIILALVGMVAVLAFTWYACRWYANRVAPVVAGKCIKVLDRLVLSKSASILIVELAGSRYLLGVSEQNMQILKELDEDVIIPAASQDSAIPIKEFFGLSNGKSFRDVLAKYKRTRGEG